MNELMSKHTGQPVERIERDFDRDRYMSAEEAKAYGLIDTIVESRGELVEETHQPSVTPERDRLA
jgi:ATP-dependent Clp protease protease subunit